MIVNIFYFWGHMISVATTQPCIVRLYYDPEISLLGIDPIKLVHLPTQKMYRTIYSSIIHINSKLKGTQWPPMLSGSTNNVTSIQQKTTNNKEQTTAMCSKLMRLTDIMLAKKKKRLKGSKLYDLYNTFI